MSLNVPKCPGRFFLGDVYMRPAVSNEPDITVTLAAENDEFIVCATDGLWDAFSSQDAVNFVHAVSLTENLEIFKNKI